jgi:hypothetical protein
VLRFEHTGLALPRLPIRCLAESRAKKSGLKGRSFNHPVGIHTCPITQIDAAILCSQRRGGNCTLV